MRCLDGRLNGHEFEQAPGDGKEQGSLMCCSPWGCKELDMTEQQQQQRFCCDSRLQTSHFPIIPLNLSG